MFDVTTAILHHDLYRVVPCCLCGAEWEEQWVSVALVVKERPLGDLCPRCLGSVPKTAARRVHEFGKRLQAVYGQMREYLTQPLPQMPPMGNVEEIKAATAKVQERAAQLRALGQQQREITAQRFGFSRQSLSQLTKLQQDLSRLFLDLRRQGMPLGEGQELVALETSLSQLEHWPTKLAEVIKLERSYYRQQFREASDHEIRRTVDDRYFQFLTQPA
jgi:hypothetical protein